MNGEVLGRFLALGRTEFADVLLFELLPLGRDVIATLDVAVVKRLGAGELIQRGRGALVLHMRLGTGLLDIIFRAALAFVQAALVRSEFAALFGQISHLERSFRTRSFSLV